MDEKKISKPVKKELSWDEIGESIGRKIERASKEGEFDCNEGKGANKFGCVVKENKSGGCAYFLGFLGALVYYWTTAPGLWEGFIGFFKALLWPAFIVYELLKFMG